jgi:hypothetical protein
MYQTGCDIIFVDPCLTNSRMNFVFILQPCDLPNYQNEHAGSLQARAAGSPNLMLISDRMDKTKMHRRNLCSANKPSDVLPIYPPLANFRQACTEKALATHVGIADYLFHYANVFLFSVGQWLNSCVLFNVKKELVYL